MRAITVRQPWAWAIIHGGKDVENRTYNIAGTYRGPVAIHAGLTPDDRGPVENEPLWRSMAAERSNLESGEIRPWSIRGAVIGVVDLVESEYCHSPSEWALPGCHHLVLARPRPLTNPIPWSGALGLWTVPAVLEACIREQVDL